MFQFLIVECIELHDQYECECDCTPVCLTNDISEYNKEGYAIYKIRKDGSLTLVKPHYQEEM